MNGYRTRHMLHDYAHDDRRQLIMHTRMTPLIEEMIMERENEETRHALQMLAWMLIVAAASVVVGAVMFSDWMGCL